MFHLIIFFLYFKFIYIPLFGGRIDGPMFWITGCLVYVCFIFVVGTLGPLENRRRGDRYYDDW